MPQSAETAQPAVKVETIPPPALAIRQSNWIPAYTRVRDLICRFRNLHWKNAHADFFAAAKRMSHAALHKFRQVIENSEHLHPSVRSIGKSDQAYQALVDMLRQAEVSDNVTRANEIRQALDYINKVATDRWDDLTTTYGSLDDLSRAMGLPPMQMPPATVVPTTSGALPVTIGPPVSVPPTTVPPPGRLNFPVQEHPIALAANPAFLEPAGGLVQPTGVPGPPLASGLPVPSLAEAAGAEVGDLGHRWFDSPATASGSTAAHPAAIETIVTPSLGGASSFWLQPADPWPAALGYVPFESGLQHAGETVRPPPATTTASSTAPALSPGAAFPTPSWPDDDFPVERALLAGLLPPWFDASPLVVDASLYAEFGLAEELIAGRLPFQVIDALVATYRATDEGGSNTPYIEYLLSLKVNIERALLDAYPERADPLWLDTVRELLGLGDDPAAPSAASATVLPQPDVMEIDRLLGTGEGASHPAPLPPPTSPGRAGVGAGTPPPAADPWRIQPPGMNDGPDPAAFDPWPVRPPGMSGEPHPVAFDPWPVRPPGMSGEPHPVGFDPWRIQPPGMSGEPHPVGFDPWPAPPGPSSQVADAETIRTPVMSTSAPPGWQGAETPGFARAASGAVELPFSRHEAIARRFGTEDALFEAQYALQNGGADALGWSDMQWLGVLADLHWLHANFQSGSAAAAARVDVDWSAIEALARFLEVLPPLS